MKHQPNAQSRIDIAIVGAGLSGLASAYLLRKAGRTVRVLEAAEQAGGRIRSFHADAEQGEVLGDRGPTWVWPEYQSVVARWLNELKIDLFEQFEDGKSIVEMSVDAPPASTVLPTQYGSMRIVGGTEVIIERLLNQLGDGIVQTNARVRRVEASEDGVTLHFRDGILRASRAVVAVPPRIAVHTIDWAPALPEDLAYALKNTSTWMAPHAKAIIVYNQPFWRERGLSGRIASRIGPLMQVHDHSSADGKTAALFGFIGWPHDARAKYRDRLPALIEQQLIRCFGLEAAMPKATLIEDWSTNELIAQPADLNGPQAHPEVAPNIVRQPLWQSKLFFASAETASQSPGLIEGAFQSAEQTVRLIQTAHDALR